MWPSDRNPRHQGSECQPWPTFPLSRHVGSFLGNVSATFVSCLPSWSAQRDVAFRSEPPPPGQRVPTLAYLPTFETCRLLSWQRFRNICQLPAFMVRTTRCGLQIGTPATRAASANPGLPSHFRDM